MYRPEKGEVYDTIRITDDGLVISSSVMQYSEDELEHTGDLQALDYKSGNCFPFASLTDHDLAIVEDCIRGLHDRT